MIALLSAPNTGTHYTLNLLNLSGQITDCIDAPHAYWGIGRKEICRFDLQYNIPKDHNKIIYQSHILDKTTHRECDLIAIGHKAITPMRDPLASLISRKHRNPAEPMYTHIDAFEYIATSPWIEQSFIFPIDTYWYESNWKYRLSRAEEMYAFAGLNTPDSLELWAKDNQAHNSMGLYPEHEAYLRRDVRSATVKCVGEFEYLKSKKDILIPFLQKLGYEDLIWW